MFRYLKSLFTESPIDVLLDQVAIQEMDLTKEDQYLVDKRQQAIEYLRSRHRYVPFDKTAPYTPSTTPITFKEYGCEKQTGV